MTAGAVAVHRLVVVLRARRVIGVVLDVVLGGLGVRRCRTV